MPKCTFCKRRKGTGNPPTCGHCYADVMTEEREKNSILDQLLDHPAVDRLVDRGIDAINSGVDRVIGRIDGYAKAAMHAQAQARQPEKPQTPDPRKVLHFGKDEPLTREKIKARQRLLASSLHPDKGGTDEAMQQINSAADELLKVVK